jgi:hypothetical protein
VLKAEIYLSPAIRKTSFATVPLIILCLLATACKGGGIEPTATTPGVQNQSSETLQLVSAAANGGIANGPSSFPAMSDDGRFVAFSSQATNLLTVAMIGTPNPHSVYLYDSCRGAGTSCTPKTTLATIAQNGGLPNGPCGNSTELPVATSTDGRYYAYDCVATNMVPQSNNGHSQILLSDTCVNAADSCVPQTVLISQGPNGGAGNQDSTQVAISPDGRFVAFASSATNLVSSPTVPPNVVQIYLRDTCSGVTSAGGCNPQTLLVSESSIGVPAQGGSSEPSIAAAGGRVVFSSVATNLDSRATSGLSQVYVRDTCGFPPNSISGCTPATELAIVNTLGNQPRGSTNQAQISPDGRFIVVASDATDLLNGNPVLNGKSQIVLADTCFAAQTSCVPANMIISIGTDAVSGNDDSFFPSISANDRFVGWTSKATNLDPSARQSLSESFVRDTCIGVPMCTPRTILISKNSQGQEANTIDGSDHSRVMVSSDGQVATFASSSTNLAANANGQGDVFLTFKFF